MPVHSGMGLSSMWDQRIWEWSWCDASHEEGLMGQDMPQTSNRLVGRSKHGCVWEDSGEIGRRVCLNMKAEKPILGDKSLMEEVT